MSEQPTSSPPVPLITVCRSLGRGGVRETARGAVVTRHAKAAAERRANTCGPSCGEARRRSRRDQRVSKPSGCGPL